MTQLLTLFRLSLSVSLLDVDNALYMTSVIDQLPPEKQKKAIRWGLVIEFLARLGMVFVFGFIASGTEVLFEIAGIAFTAETLSLLAAGIFLLIHSTKDLLRFFVAGDEDEPSKDQIKEKSLGRVILDMSLINALLSVDTVIAITGSAVSEGAEFVLIVYLLLFSAILRLLFVQEIARFIKKYPATNIIILAFLIAISIELIAQGLGAAVPERMFNGVMLLALFVAIIYQLRYTSPDEPASQNG
jgi:predicted tellurium resistance membrane protein TerC